MSLKSCEQVQIQKRSSGIELLRIIALLMVIVIHYADLLFSLELPPPNYQFFLLFRTISSPAVDLFILISGYFMVTNDNRDLGKPISLLLQVIYRNYIVFALLLLLGLADFSFKGLLFYSIPMSYYPVLFVVLYFISPYLNLLLRHIVATYSPKALKVFLLISFILFSIYPTLTDFMAEVFNYEWFGLNSVSAYGDQKGFTIINFMLLYIVGGAIRLTNFEMTSSKLVKLILLCIALIYIWTQVCDLFTIKGMRSSWVYCNPLVILYSLLLFLYFKNLKVQSNFINSTAQLVYMCFLIHSGIIANFNIGLQNIVSDNIMLIVLHYILFTIIMFAISKVLLYIYNQFYKLVPQRIRDFKINYQLTKY